jgi:cholesterol transport system auxiliary component
MKTSDRWRPLWPVLLLPLAACSGLRSNAPVTQIYLLQPSPVVTAAAAAEAPTATLTVLLPVVAPGLASDRISLVHADGRLDSYAASRWPDGLPLVLQPLLIDALRAGGRFRAVQSDAMPFNAEFLLQVEVRQFAIAYDAADHPVATVNLVCTLGRRADRVPVRSFSIATEVAATANRMGAVISAYDQAVGKALQELVTQANP